MMPFMNAARAGSPAARGGGAAPTAYRLYFNDAGTPPGGVTKDTTAPKSGAQGWLTAFYYGFVDRGTGTAGSANPWLWRGGGIGASGYDPSFKNEYRITCTVGGTVAVRAYCYDGNFAGPVVYTLKQRKGDGTYVGAVSSSPNGVQNVSGGVCVGTFMDVDAVGYIDLEVTSNNGFICWNGLDYVESSNTADLPTAWAY